MQAVVIRDVGAFDVTDLPVPEPAPGEALVRVTVTGLCRTDLKIVRHGHRDLTLPRVPGEEVVGEIVRFGPAGASAPKGWQAFAPGDRVYVHPGIWCGECPSCSAPPPMGPRALIDARSATAIALPSISQLQGSR